MTPNRLQIGSTVEIAIRGGGTERGTVAVYRLVGESFEATIKTASGALLTGVVIPQADGSLTEIYDADTIARAVLAGRELRLPLGRQMQVLATAVLARRGAA